MKFNSIVSYVGLLALVQLLLLRGEYIYRSIPRKDTLTTDESLLIEVWLMIFCSVNAFIITMIWCDLFRQCTNGNQWKSCVHLQSPKLPSSLNRLPPFRSLQSYHLLHIRRSTTQAILNEIIPEVRCTRKFTIAIKSDTVIYQTMSVYIEAIQSTRSLIIVIDYDHARDLKTKYASIISQIFSLIFRGCNLVQSWGNLRLQLKCFLSFELFIDEQLIEVYSIDKQRSFHEWYNRLPVHQDNDGGYTDAKRRFHSYSCTLPEYPSNVSRVCSLSEVIALCFDEPLDADQFDINHCLAITKLSNFLHNPLSHEQFCHQVQ